MYTRNHIFLDATTLCATHSGTGVYTENMLHYLQQRKDVHLDAAFRSSFLQSSTANSIKTHPRTKCIPQSEHPHLSLNAGLWGNRIRSEASAAIFPNYFMPFGWPTQAAVTIHDVSFITHPQFYSQKMRWFYTTRIRHTVKNASLILTVSEASRLLINRHLGISTDRIMVHPPASARELHISEHPSPRSRPYLLYIGNLEPKKNIIPMLKAFELAGNGDMDFILIGKIHAGSSQWRRQLRSIIDANPHIIHAGYLSAQLRDNYLCNAAGLVQCSHTEGFGITLLDAQSNGIPTVISRDAAMQEVSGGLSITVDETSVASIAGGISSLIENRNPRQNIPFQQRDFAKEHALSTFSKEQSHGKLDEIIERLLQKQRVVFPAGARAVTAGAGLVKAEAGMVTAEAGLVKAGAGLVTAEARTAAAPATAVTAEENLFNNKRNSPAQRHSVISAIAYSAVFGGPVGVDKLYHSIPFERMSRGTFNRALGDVLTPLFPLLHMHENQLYFTSLMESWTAKRKASSPSDDGSKANSSSMTDASFVRQNHHRLIRKLGRLPWIKALYYSGGTAHQQETSIREDLDIFVVAARNRVWLAWLTTKLLGGGSTRLCANYLVDEDAQEITWQQDFYTAHQLLFLRQVIRKPGVNHIRNANPFVHDFFPNAPTFSKNTSPLAKTLGRTETAETSGGVGNEKTSDSTDATNTSGQIGTIVNSIIFGIVNLWWRLTNRNSASGGMLWDLHRIKLHTNDHRPAIYKRYGELLNQCLELTGPDVSSSNSRLHDITPHNPASCKPKLKAKRLRFSYLAPADS